MLFKKKKEAEVVQEEMKEVLDESKIQEKEEINDEDIIENYVALIDVNKIYEGGVHAVYDFNLEIKEGEFVVFVGPSGCGKSTTLRMIAGIEDITSGELYINGLYFNDITAKDRNIAMVFQNYSLYPNMTVYDNIGFSLIVHHVPKEEIDQRVKRTAEILGIMDLLNRKPKALSGGQRQRVALGRAIVRDAQVFLMDEPLSNLDAKLRVQMRSEIISLHNRLKTTTIYVTHDQVEAMTMADRIVVMKDGYIQQIGTPIEIYRHPINKFVASFIGSPAMNFIFGRYVKGEIILKDNEKIKLDKQMQKEVEEYYKNSISKLESRIYSLRNRLEEENQKILKKKHIFRKPKLIDIDNDDELLRYQRALEEAKKINEDSGYEFDIILGIRPENIKQGKNESSFKPKIKFSELLGDSYYIHFTYGDTEVVSKIISDELIDSKKPMDLYIEEKKIHLFDAITEEAII